MPEELTQPEFSETQSRAEYTVGIFGTGTNKTEIDQNAIQNAAEIASQLVNDGFSIATGGYAGIMESASVAAAEKAKELGIEPIDRIKAFPFKPIDGVEVPMEDTAEVVRSRTLPERLTHLIAESSAFVILSGSTGTITELLTTLESEKVNRIIDKNLPPKPVIIIDPSLKHTDMLSNLAALDQKFKSSPVLQDIYILNYDENPSEKTVAIIDGYYQASQNREFADEVRQNLSEYSFKQFLQNRETFTDGSGI